MKLPGGRGWLKVFIHFLFEDCHGQADDGGGIAGYGDGPAGVLAFKKVVAARFSLPQIGVEVVI